MKTKQIITPENNNNNNNPEINESFEEQDNSPPPQQQLLPFDTIVRVSPPPAVNTKSVRGRTLKKRC